jgi:hypothetical protein
MALKDGLEDTDFRRVVAVGKAKQYKEKFEQLSSTLGFRTLSGAVERLSENP